MKSCKFAGSWPKVSQFFFLLFSPFWIPAGSSLYFFVVRDARTPNKNSPFLSPMYTNSCLSPPLLTPSCTSSFRTGTEDRKSISDIQTITAERHKDYLAQNGNFRLLHMIICCKVIILDKGICWETKEHSTARAIAGSSFKLIEDVF